MSSRKNGHPDRIAVQEGLTDEDLKHVLDYLMAHKMEFAQRFLRERSLPFSGTKAVLRDRLKGYLDNEQVTGEELIELLNDIEGWGNQHIYLYKSPNQVIEQWRQRTAVEDRLKELGMIEQLNRRRPLILPSEPTLSTIEWTPDRIHFLWVEKRQWEERIPEEDIERDDIVWKAYRRRTSRGLTSFDWDLVSGHAMLMIQRLPRGTKYNQIRDLFEKKLEPIIELKYFERIRVSPAIQSIEESGEVRRRQLAYETLRGGRARFTSANRAMDTYADPALERAGQALGGDKAGWLGNFYWHPVPGSIERELHSKLYALDQRVGIFGDRLEQEVRYVISRIRYYCS
jgi:hypothetical protein